MIETTAATDEDFHDLVTRVELAKILNLTPNRIAQLEEEGWLDPVNDPAHGRGKAKVYSLTVFMRFLAARGGYCPTCRRGSKQGSWYG